MEGSIGVEAIAKYAKGLMDTLLLALELLLFGTVGIVSRFNQQHVVLLTTPLHLPRRWLPGIVGTR